MGVVDKKVEEDRAATDVRCQQWGAGYGTTEIGPKFTLLTLALLVWGMLTMGPLKIGTACNNRATDDAHCWKWCYRQSCPR